MRPSHLLAAVSLAAALAACRFSFSAGHSDDKGPKHVHTAGQHQSAAAPAHAPEDPEAMMATYMKLATPGEHHQHLEPLVGTFKASTKMWMDPAAPAQESGGIMESRWVLGGRFLLSTFKGETLGMPFEGIGLMGYDNGKQAYVGVWCDSMNTLIMPVSEGQCSNGGKRIEMRRSMFDPVAKRDTPMRDVTTIEGPNEHRFEMYMTGPDGKEFKMLEIHYVRA